MNISDLLQTTYAALSDDPQPQPALQIGFTPLQGVVPAAYWLEVRDGVLYGTNGAGAQGNYTATPTGTPLVHPNLVIDLHGLSLQTLQGLIAATPGFTCTLMAGVNTNYAALMLCEAKQDVVQTPLLSIATSVLWAIFRPIADAFTRARTDTDEGLKQINPQYATGLWLSSLGDLYGVDRQADEPDEMYSTRVLYTVLKPRANNNAMADYLRYALQLQSVTVQDDDPSLHTGIGSDVALPYRFYVDLQPTPAGGLPISPASVINIVQAIKAWGTIWALRIIDLYTETYTSTAVEEGVVVTLQTPTEDASAYGKNETPTLHIIVNTIEHCGLPKETFMASVWKTDNASNLPQNPGYNPASGSIVASAASDPSVVTAGPVGIGYDSIVASITEIWHDYEGPYTGSDAYATTSTVTEAATVKLLQTDGYPTVQNVVEQDGSRVVATASDQVPERWRPFLASSPFSQASTLLTFVSDPPGIHTSSPYSTTIGEMSRFSVTKNGVTHWYSDTNHPASF